jgi:hypothetical protein
MVEAALRHDLHPREVSFKGAWQTLSAYRPLVERATAANIQALYDDLLTAIASHRVGDRPNRVRTACDQTSTQTSGAPDHDQRPGQTPTMQRTYGLRKCHSGLIVVTVL